MVLPAANPTKSYWIEAAESPLRDFRSSEQLPDEVDVAVIGSGYAGAATAYWIHKYTQHAAKKPRMLMLEARDICGCATGRNGGQLRPHVYSRYTAWKERFGAAGAMELIEHEVAHLAAFEKLAEEEGIAEETCLRFGETFDAAMSDEAWIRLKGAYEAMRADHGDENDAVRSCKLVEDAAEAERFTQMKGALAAVVHPTAQIWPYKFVHALLRIVLAAGNLNLQAHTPVTELSERDQNGWFTIGTGRGTVRARTVIHSTNGWASHLLPEFDNIILRDRATLAAIKAPPGFIKHTGAQHWDSAVNNYHLQLPPPYNAIILGGARQLLVHKPDACFPSNEDDKQIDGVAEFFRSWPESDVKDWPASAETELDGGVDGGGCWTGIETTSADSFPFVGPVPNRNGQFMAAGFAGHGMPRILLSAAHIAPLVLQSLGHEHAAPELVAPYPALPTPFHVTSERVERLKGTDVSEMVEAQRARLAESARKPFCDVGGRVRADSPLGDALSVV